MRKGIGKRKWHEVLVHIEADDQPIECPIDLSACLEDEPSALQHVQSMPKSYQNYYTKWIESAKTEETRIKRISRTIIACARGMNYAEMIRTGKSTR